jgi:hypothetical protein
MKRCLSGFCDPPTPDHTRHRHCPTDADCPCPCHNGWPDGSPRVKVPLACLQGAHTPDCGHLGDPRLTDDEKRRVVAAHMNLRPQAILDTVEQIVNERIATWPSHD